MSNYQKTACCEDTEGNLKKDIKEDNQSYRGNVEEQASKELEDDHSCSCGGKFPDESLVTNPENPQSNAGNDFFREFEEQAHSMGIVEIGYTRLDTELLNSKDIDYPNAIVLTFKMDKELIKTPPGEEAQKLNEAIYAEFAKITYQLSDYLRSNGYATQVAHPYGDLIGLAELGQQAGLGYIGKHGLLITPKLGPKLKISAIFTSIGDLPEKTPVDHSWIDEYCQRCSKCTIACRENALVKIIHPSGEKDTEFHQELCIGCNKGCTSCIEECVFYKRGYDEIKRISDKLKERMLKKKQNTNIYHIKRKKR